MLSSMTKEIAFSLVSCSYTIFFLEREIFCAVTVISVTQREIKFQLVVFLSMIFGIVHHDILFENLI